MYAFLADVIVVVHFGIVSFCVAGELAILAGAFFKWSWVRNMIFRVVHLGLVLYVAGESIFGVTCPLTDWENRLRMAAGQRYDQNLSFVARIVRSIIFYDFPAWVFTTLYIGFGIVVLLTWIFIGPLRTKIGKE
ncbi:MAG: DUF2784 domain-containing protein [Rectinemataceae bacterium]